MREGAGHYASRLSKERTDQIQIVHAVIHDFDARNALEKREQAPWGENIKAHLHVQQFSYDSGVDKTPRRQDKWREPQLAIDRRMKILASTHLKNFLCLSHAFTHRLLNEHKRMIRQLAQGLSEHRGWQRQIVDHIRRCGRDHFSKTGKNVGYRKLLSQLFRPRLSPIHDSPHGKTCFSVSGEVCIFDDSACANDGDREKFSRKLCSGYDVGEHRSTFISKKLFCK